MTTIMEKTSGLAAFVRTVEAGSFAEAARLLGATPSAVSKSVLRLERRLGVRLIQRSTRTLSATSEGAAYYERVAPLLRAIDDAEELVQRADTARGLLRVTVPVLFGRILIAAWAEWFTVRHPDVRLELGVTDRNVDIIHEGYDIAVRMGALEDTGLVGRSLGEARFVLAASPRYLERRGRPRTLAELRRHAGLRFVSAGRPYPWIFADGTAIVPDGPFDTDDGLTLRHAALAGAGIAQLPRFVIADDLAAGRLVVVLPEAPMTGIPTHALHAFGRQLPLRARLFIDFLVERIAL
jgi:DNA-binding transcriptional LysR family regulator